MRILMISSEVYPYTNVAGTGEVLASLPGALVKQGIEVDVLMPLYRSVDQSRFCLEKYGKDLKINVNDKDIPAEIFVTNPTPGRRNFFLKCDQFYDREGIYGTEKGDYQDNSERFVFLSRAAIEMALLNQEKYHIFHSHNWQTALVPVYLRTLYVGEQLLRESASALTIHNLGYQGIFWHWDMPLIGVGWEYFTPEYMEFYGNVNFLKSGIVFADQVNTVSKGYREEILTPEYGFGLEGVLNDLGTELKGILNGVDYSVWNPEADQHLAARYSSRDIFGKSVCKAEFQIKNGFSVNSETPLFAVISRFCRQKGTDLLVKILPDLLQEDIQFVVLGNGEPQFHEFFENLTTKYPKKFAAFINYDYELTHKIFAAADMFVMPSRYEPCGLTQLYAMRYGTVPIVRATGGLKDTIEQFNLTTHTGTGFKFHKNDPKEMLEVLKSTAAFFRSNKDAWTKLMKRDMEQDFSWEKSAREYISLYEKALDKRMRKTR